MPDSELETSTKVEASQPIEGPRWNYVVTGILTINFAILLRELHPDVSPKFLLQLYGMFLFGYWTWVAWHEYTAFFRLHRLKSPASDMFLIAGLALALRQFVIHADDLVQAFMWLSVFLFIACAWETYTMRCGYKTYFNQAESPVDIRSWLSLLTTPLLPLKTPTWSHWNEYRYWLVLDATAMLMFATFASVYPHYRSPLLDNTVTVSVACLLTAMGLIIILRYNTVRRSSILRGGNVLRAGD